MTDEEQNAFYLGTAVTDEYRLGSLDFDPDVIYDLGADVGSVSLFAHRRFPNAKLVAVEPHPWSYGWLLHNAEGIPEIIPLNVAIGEGAMYASDNACSPLNYAVISADSPVFGEGFAPTPIQGIRLDELYAVHGGKDYVIKLDIEGGEYGIVSHPGSRLVLLGSRYFAAEFHFWGRTNELMNQVVTTLMGFVFDLAQVHNIHMHMYGACLHIWSKRREGGVVDEH